MKPKMRIIGIDNFENMDIKKLQEDTNERNFIEKFIE